MSEPESSLDPALDRLLADHWERAQQRVDASDLLQRVRQSRQNEAAIFASMGPAERPEHKEAEHAAEQPVAPSVAVARAAEPAHAARPALVPQWLTWSALAAAVLLAALLALGNSSPATANASLALRDLRSVHLGQLDRCYRVQYAPDPRYWDETNRLEGPSHSLLWTRGDRFLSECTINELQLRIGRQRDGALWLRSTPQRALEFHAAPSELPQEVALLCAANSLSVPRLVEDVLADFDLRAATPTDPSSGSRMVVWASLKPGRVHSVISAALLEIDSADHSLNRLVLWMIRNGQPRGTVTYTFLESGTLDESQYELRTHLSEDAQIERQRFNQMERNE